ncbi:MAG: hypothetical protein ABSG41_26895 [Bryobacteraceae bacterium]
MRTTLSIDDDVAALLKKEMRQSGSSLKQAVNRLLRLGLTAAPPRGKPFTVRPRKLGLPPGLGYDNVEELIESLEGPRHG